LKALLLLPAMLLLQLLVLLLWLLPRLVRR
jgi:hypothetical protein